MRIPPSLRFLAPMGIALMALPQSVLAQVPPPSDTVRVALIVRVSAPNANPREGPAVGDPVRGAVVLRSNVEIGRTNDFGYVMLFNLPAARVTLNLQAPTFAPLTCRITPRANRVDTIAVTMMLERKVAVWESPGCRRL